MKVSERGPGRDNTAGANRTYTLNFDPAEGDGVRIIGAPGGMRTFAC